MLCKILFDVLSFFFSKTKSGKQDMNSAYEIDMSHDNIPEFSLLRIITLISCLFKERTKLHHAARAEVLTN